MKRIIISLSTVAVLAIGTAAFAQPGGLNKADTNGDGVISFTEFAARADARFIKADTNLDNVVTPQERQAARQAHMAERRTKKFDATDANDDGVLTRSETEAKAAERAAKMQERKEQRAERPKRDRAEKGDKAQKREKRDPNAVITRADHDTRTAAKFTKMDVNGDGVLSGEELKPKKRGKRGGKKRRG